MKSSRVKVDYTTLGPAMARFVRDQAIHTGTTIVYKSGGRIIEEDPKTGEKRSLTTKKTLKPARKF